MNIRRYYIPDTIIFITQVVEGRQPVFSKTVHLELLRTTLRKVKEIHPFHMLGYVFLPDHFHLLIRPTGESNFSVIMHSLKRNFTLNYKQHVRIEGPMKFWQKRFWDHVIRDELDLARHLDYIHYNPVAHGYVIRPDDWHASSFAYWKRQGMYPPGWGESLPVSIQRWSEGIRPEME